MAGETVRMCPSGEELPDGWQVKRLGSFCTKIGTGATPRGGSEVYLNSRISHALVRSQHVFDRHFDTAGLAFISNGHAKELRNAEIQPGDVLLNITGDGVTFGRSCIVPDRVLPACVNQHVAIIRPDRRECDPGYLLSVLTHPSTKSYIESFNSGGSRRAITKGHIESFEIPLPPITKQKAIATVLGALDDKIELNRRMNATLEAMARALFKSWFVDFDPVRAKLDGRQPTGMDPATAALFPDSFQDSELGPIPKGWTVKELGEFAEIDKGLSYKGNGLAEEGGMPMVNLGCFSGRGIFNAAKIKRYTGEYRDRHLVHSGDLVIANTDMTQHRVIIGSPALVPKLDGESKFLFTHHVFAVRFKPDTEVWRRYVYFTLLKPEFREIAEGFSTGTTVLALPRDGLVNYSLCLSPLPLVEAFEKQAEPLLAAIHANDHQSRTLAILRDTMLPKLLSGELSVNDLNAASK